MAGLDAFIEALRVDPIYAPCADQYEQAFTATAREADDNGDALEFLDAISWIGRQPKTIAERLAAIDKLVSTRGKVTIPSLRKFFGWDK